MSRVDEQFEDQRVSNESGLPHFEELLASPGDVVGAFELVCDRQHLVVIVRKGYQRVAAFHDGYSQRSSRRRMTPSARRTASETVPRSTFSATSEGQW